MHLFFLGKKAFNVLQDLCKSFRDLNKFHVVIGKDSGVDNDFSLEIENLCLQNDIQFEYRDHKKTYRYSYGLAIGWRWLVKNNDQSKLFVIHDSILPKYRGFNPLVTALINGDDNIGATCILANKDFDCGDIFDIKAVNITYPIRISDAIDIVSDLYIELSTSLINKIFSNENIALEPQKDDDATYSLWRDEEDYRIDWSADASSIKRKIDSVGRPYSGASSSVGSRVLRIYSASIVEDMNISNRTPGKVIRISNGMPHVVCGIGILELNEMMWDDSNVIIDRWKKVRVRFK